MTYQNNSEDLAPHMWLVPQRKRRYPVFAVIALSMAVTIGMTVLFNAGAVPATLMLCALIFGCHAFIWQPHDPGHEHAVMPCGREWPLDLMTPEVSGLRESLAGILKDVEGFWKNSMAGAYTKDPLTGSAEDDDKFDPRNVARVLTKRLKQPHPAMTQWPVEAKAILEFYKLNGHCRKYANWLAGSRAAVLPKISDILAPYTQDDEHLFRAVWPSIAWQMEENRKIADDFGRTDPPLSLVDQFKWRIEFDPAAMANKSAKKAPRKPRGAALDFFLDPCRL